VFPVEDGISSYTESVGDFTLNQSEFKPPLSDVICESV
jgi:hypothetical protein